VVGRNLASPAGANVILMEEFAAPDRAGGECEEYVWNRICLAQENGFLGTLIYYTGYQRESLPIDHSIWE
jgi:hypothetical protein